MINLGLKEEISTCPEEDYQFFKDVLVKEKYLQEIKVN